MTKRPTVQVTDHAILRYLERVEGWDIAGLRNQLARSASVGLVYGARVVVIAGGKLVLQEDRVVTVLAHAHQPTSTSAADMAIGVVHRRRKGRK